MSRPESLQDVAGSPTHPESVSPSRFRRYGYPAIATLSMVTLLPCLWTFDIDFYQTYSSLGFPLTFRREDWHVDPPYIQWFIPALLFDMAFAGWVILATCVEAIPFSRRASRYGLGWKLTFYGAVMTAGLFWRWWPGMLLLLATFPFVLAVVTCDLWMFTERIGTALLGPTRALVLPFIMMVGVPVLGYFAAPRDVVHRSFSRDSSFLAKSLDNPDPRVRLLALRSLRSMAPFSDTTSQAVVRLMTDEDPRVAHQALDMVLDLGPVGTEAIPILIERLRQGEDRTFQLGRLGPAAAAALPALRERLEKETDYGKIGVYFALWKIEGHAESVVPGLVELVKRREDLTADHAVDLLGAIGPPAAAAVPELQRILSEPPPPAAPPEPDLAPAPEDRNRPAPPRPLSANDRHAKLMESARSALRSIERKGASP